MNYKIEKGIEIPKQRRECKFPFNDMDVGDSFVYSEYSRSNMTSISNAARNWARARKNGFVFSCRKMDNKIRIWRIK